MNRKRNHQVLVIGPLWRMRVTKAAKKRIAASDTERSNTKDPPSSSLPPTFFFLYALIIYQVVKGLQKVLEHRERRDLGELAETGKPGPIANGEGLRRIRVWLETKV
ncbi:hypothetical protein BYT27DRAFT_7240696 [Phlegmacium glaucopus]|nr:hypothetical protein BYT27DRAFT_7240696 [Phlegmacium glaucopus]